MFSEIYLRENHGRPISRTYIQDILRAVGNVASTKSWKYTTYLAQAPEYGKETFYRDFTKEIETIKEAYPEKTYVGVVDGRLKQTITDYPF